MREGLIKELRDYYNAYVCCGDEPSHIAQLLAEAADAIEERSKSKPDNEDDYISRKMALEAIQRERDWLLSHGMTGAEHWLTHCGYNVIAELPAIDMNISRNRKSTAQTAALI